MDIHFFFDNVDNSESLIEYTKKKLKKFEHFNLPRVDIRFFSANNNNGASFDAKDCFVKQTGEIGEDFYACIDNLLGRVFEKLSNKKD